MIQCNSTLAELQINETPLWEGAHALTFHELGLIISAIFGLISVIIALFLIFRHATRYLKPFEQKHIIRILLMIPIYSTVSFLSYLHYKHAVYYQVLRDCYEAFAIASFFTLMCHYIAPNLHEQKVFFRTMEPVNWFWGVFGLQLCTGGENKGPFRKPRSGLTWFNVVWIGVFQYCFIRVLFTIVSVLAEVGDRYCEHSLSPAFAHIWVTCFEGASVTIAMFCLIQFYIQLKTELAEHKPFMKVLCIKLVIFFSFWQTLVISFLASSSGPLQPTAKLNYPDIYIGIPSVLLCIEMAFFAVLHIFAFSSKPYSLKYYPENPIDAPGSGYSGPPPKYKGGPLGIKALADAFNPWDVIKASARGFRWLFVGVRHRHQDSSYGPAPGKVGSMNGYTGPLYAGSGEAATELQRPSRDPAATQTFYQQPGGRDRGDTLATDATVEDEDRHGLLNYSAQPGRRPSDHSHSNDARGHSPYRPFTNDEYAPGDDSQLDLGAPGRPARMPTMPASPPKMMDYGDGGLDTGYHGAGAGGVHPAYRKETAGASGVNAEDWSHWGGVARGSGDDENLRPEAWRREPGR